MKLDLTPEDQAFRVEIRTYFAGLMTPQVRAAEPGSTEERQLLRRLGADGWLGVGWPREYGGQERPVVQRLIFFDEAARADVPIPAMSILTVGPTLMRFGSPEQRARFVPPILRGEIQFAVGYTEPGAGTDVASLQTRAVRDGDDFVVNGTKAFTSGALTADFIWLACRTNPEAPKHKGLSILIVPTTAPGFRVAPMRTMTTRRTTMTYYDNVRVPATNLVGEENDGWHVMTAQLNHERFAVALTGPVMRHLDGVTEWASNRKLPDGRRVIDQEWVRISLARIAAKAEYLKLANLRGAWTMAVGAPSPVDASVCKVFATEFYKEAYRLLLEVLGSAGPLCAGSPNVVVQGELEAAYRTVFLYGFSGGANEIQRDLIAVHGLGMPRSRR